MVLVRLLVEPEHLQEREAGRLRDGLFASALLLLGTECAPDRGPRFVDVVTRSLRCQESTIGDLCSPGRTIKQWYPAGAGTNSQKAIHDFSNTLELQGRYQPGFG